MLENGIILHALYIFSKKNLVKLVPIKSVYIFEVQRKIEGKKLHVIRETIILARCFSFKIYVFKYFLDIC